MLFRIMSCRQSVFWPCFTVLCYYVLPMFTNVGMSGMLVCRDSSVSCFFVQPSPAIIRRTIHNLLIK